MNDRHLLVGVLGFTLGIFVHTVYALSWLHVVYAGWLLTTLSLLFAVKRLSLYLLICLFLLGATFGMARTEMVPTTLPSSFSYLLSQEDREVEGVIVADPDIRETTQRLTVEIREGSATTKILIVAPLYPSVSYGEAVRAKGTIEAPTPFDTDGGRVFAYDKFLSKDGIFLVMQNAEVAITAPRKGTVVHLQGALSDLKFSGIDALARALPEPHASLAAGIILGGKQGLGETLLDDFIRSGLVHIVVLSGYNVMIVAEFVMRVFSFLPSVSAASLGAFTIAAFVLAAGAGPASIRAGLMAGIALYGRATGRTYEAFRALLVAGVLMLLWNPLTLIYDPGFQLSFVATLGLIFGVPLVERWLTFITSSFLREITASTLAAQIAVLPLLLYQNGLFSLVALPANFLVLPLVPLAMLTSFIAMIAGALLPAVAYLIGVPSYVLLSYIIGTVEVVAHLPLAAVTVPSFSFVVVVIAYALLFLCVRNATPKLLSFGVPPPSNSH